MKVISIFLAFPVLAISMIIQTAVVSRMTMLSGCADLIMLVIIAWALQEKVTTAWEWGVIGGMMVSLISAMPFLSPLFIYLLITAIARLLHMRVWQMPILAMFIITLAGTIIQHLISITVLKLFYESPITWEQGISQVTIPSLVLNLFLAFPVYVLISELVNMLYPSREEVEI